MSVTKSSIRETFKRTLTRLGSHSSAGVICALDGVINYLELGRWMRVKGFRTDRIVADRWKVFDVMAEEVADRRVLYLEFGVHRGDSTAYWAKLLKDPESVLHGFDSFEGLPERWNPKHDKSHFSTDGKIPVIDDPRVRFFKGWFADVLPSYVLPEHNQLVIIIDADLYSSTTVALNFLKDRITVGTFLYFDEFNDRIHELKAFDEFLDETGMTFRLCAANPTMTHVTFQRIA